MSDCLDAAPAYAARSWPVFPLRPPRNTPLTKHGFHDASTDPDTITAWWSRWPTANIGGACGITFDVLDIDHDDYVTGVAALPDCTTDGGPVARTGSGRFHIYFAPSGHSRRIRFSAHCDWLGVGGYVVVPPSTHRSGGRYEWYAPDTLALRSAPSELLAAVAPPRSAPSPSTPSSPSQPSRWRGLVGTVAAAPEGQRNQALHWAACRIGADAASGRLDDVAVALDELHTAAVRAGLTDSEVESTIRSGYKRGHGR